MSIQPQAIPKKPKAKRSKPLPVHLEVRILVDPATGKRVRALTAAFKADRMIMAERDYKVGDILRADLTKARNPKFFRLVHGLGTLLKRNVEAFHACADAHAAIKQLQRESGVCCEVQNIDIPGLGTLAVKVAQSLAFDQMDEETFAAFWKGITAHLITAYWPTCDEHAIAEMVELLPEREA